MNAPTYEMSSSDFKIHVLISELFFLRLVVHDGTGVEGNVSYFMEEKRLLLNKYREA